MSRYWVNLGLWSNIPDLSTEDKTKMAAVEEELLEIAAKDGMVAVGLSGALVVKTWDAEEAERVLSEAIAIVKKHFDSEHVRDGMNITKQPECSKCGELLGFSALYCSKCGGRSDRYPEDKAEKQEGK